MRPVARVKEAPKDIVELVRKYVKAKDKRKLAEAKERGRGKKTKRGRKVGR
jgi:hypothetical protein